MHDNNYSSKYIYSGQGLVRLRICANVPPDELTAQHYGHIKANLERAGSRSPENDLWIAALAREHQLPLVTRDQHFSLVTGLHAVAW
jgi:tRNA(fMet)-specific endonuclease VapC